MNKRKHAVEGDYKREIILTFILVAIFVCLIMFLDR